jgi:acyl carrier protein
MSTRDRAIEVIAAVLKLPASALNDRSSPDDVASWDSLHHLQIILALEEEFAVQFAPDDIDHLQTVGMLVAAVTEQAG